MKLELLKELVQVIGKNKVKQIEIIGDPSASSTQPQELYEGIASGKFDSSEAIGLHFFGESPHRSAYTNRLQRTLKDRLLNTLFFIDVNQDGFSDIQKAYYTCYKNLAAVKILIGRYAKNSGVELAEKTIKKAIEFEFTDLVLELARDLRLQFSYVPGEKKKQEYYNELVNYYHEVYAAELQVEEFYTQLIQNFTQTKGSSTKVANLAEKYSNEIKQKLNLYDTYRFRLSSYLVLSLRCEIVNDYKGNLNVCLEALDFFESKSHIASNTVLFNFLARTLVSYIQLGHHSKAEDTAKKCLNLQPEGSINWFQTLDYSMILFFHSSQFSKAYKSCRTATEHPNFKHQYKNISEHWRIYEAFIYLLILLRKIRPEPGDQLKKFRIKKFLNEVPTFAKDKRGANINILILHVLFLLQQGQYDEIIDRMESLKTYTHRYLRRDETFRSNCFIKMLLTLPQVSFHRKAVLRRAKKYWDRLQEVPLMEANQNVELEIIPYEMLWQFTLELLDENWH